MNNQSAMSTDTNFCPGLETGILNFLVPYGFHITDAQFIRTVCLSEVRLDLVCVIFYTESFPRL